MSYIITHEIVLSTNTPSVRLISLKHAHTTQFSLSFRAKEQKHRADLKSRIIHALALIRAHAHPVNSISVRTIK